MQLTLICGTCGAQAEHERRPCRRCNRIDPEPVPVSEFEALPDPALLARVEATLRAATALDLPSNGRPARPADARRVRAVRTRLEAQRGILQGRALGLPLDDRQGLRDVYSRRIASIEQELERLGEKPAPRIAAAAAVHRTAT